MIRIELMRDKGIAVITPRGPLEAQDFHAVAGVVDPYIAEKGKLKGVLIHAPDFPGWDSLSALIEHMKFVRDHHRLVERVAAVTESPFLRIAPRIAEHFAQPKIEVFASNEKERALRWLETGK